MIPINRDLKRELWIRSIERDPTTVNYMHRAGDTIELFARISNVSQARKISVAGLTEEIPELECKIYMPVGSDAPEPMRDRVSIDGVVYRILEVSIMRDADCYILTLVNDNG